MLGRLFFVITLLLFSFFFFFFLTGILTIYVICKLRHKVVWRYENLFFFFEKYKFVTKKKKKKKKKKRKKRIWRYESCGCCLPSALKVAWEFFFCFPRNSFTNSFFFFSFSFFFPALNTPKIGETLILFKKVFFFKSAEALKERTKKRKKKKKMELK